MFASPNRLKEGGREESGMNSEAPTAANRGRKEAA